MMSYNYDDDEEPSFSLHDFKRWLDGQGDMRMEETIRPERDEAEEKQRFKERLRKRRKKD
jgi:hypothetical protein